ncbi:phage baseplate plug family protein [Lentilactobacillus senioris]|uniref:phage baseplate plug family protein n=1 Tax=Lentilactobacillus senioris TaxID=931534 RepID=UPI003D2E6F1B
MYMDTIQFNKFQLPETFLVTLSGNDYEITVSYNEVNDRLYLTLADENGEPLVTNEKLVAREPLFADISDANLPSEDLVMIDETGKSTCVNFSNINEDIFITIDDTFTGEMDPDNTNDGVYNPDGDDTSMGLDDDDSDDSMDDDEFDGLDDFVEDRGDA